LTPKAMTLNDLQH